MESVLLDSDDNPMGELDVLVRLTARALGAPVAFIARLEGERLEDVAWYGPRPAETLGAFRRVAASAGELVEVSDTLLDPAWHDRPLTAGDDRVRSLAAVPLVASSGRRIGLLAALRFEPRTLSDERRRALHDMGRLALAKLVASPLAAEDDEDDRQIHSREHYQSMVKAMAEGILLRSADGRILTCNTSAERILGVSRTELAGRKPLETAWRLIREDGTLLEEHEYPTIVTLRTGEPCTEVVLGVVKRDEVTWISINTQPLKKPGEPRPHAVVASFSDITHLKRTEEALEDSMQRTEELRKLFEIANAMLCITGFDGYFKQLNPAWERLLGYSLDELMERPFLHLVHPDDRAASLREGERLMAGPAEMTSFENRYRHRDGSYRWLSWNGISDPVAERVYAVATDVTERRRAQAEREKLIRQLEEKNTELERYSYTVSHDLKSPLLTIRGFLGYIERSALRGDVEQLQADMARVLDAADKMERLLDEILELSRVGRTVNPPREVSLSELARDAAALVSRQLDQGAVELVIPDELPSVLCDQTRLLQVFQNLLDNAVKFMGDEPRPRIEIEAKKEPGWTVCSVRDNGIGIDPRYLGRVFGLFEQIDPESGGTGIGLAMVKRIVEVHGGHIRVESEGRGRGACFTFTLPDEPPLLAEEGAAT